MCPGGIEKKFRHPGPERFQQIRDFKRVGFDLAKRTEVLIGCAPVLFRQHTFDDTGAAKGGTAFITLKMGRSGGVEIAMNSHDVFSSLESCHERKSVLLLIEIIEALIIGSSRERTKRFFQPDRMSRG